MSAQVEQIAIFSVMSFLVLLFGWTYMRDRQQHIAYWMLGWIAIFIHFAAQLLFSFSLLSPIWTAFVRVATLLVAGISFHLSVSEVFNTRRRRALYICLVGAPAILYLLFMLWGPRTPVVFPLLLALSVSAVAAISFLHHGRGLYFFSVFVPVAMYSGWAIRESATGNPMAGLNFYLSIFFLVAGLLYWRKHRRFSPGVMTTSVAFVLWGLIFPASQILSARHIGPPFDSIFWDMPKYFVAFGMILTLYENQTERANIVAGEYQVLFEGNLAGVYVATLQGQLIDCNTAFVNMYGYATKEEILAISAPQLYDEPGEWKWLSNRVKDYGQVINYECRQRKRDGSTFWILERATIMTDPAGQGLIEGTAIDITERKQSEMALKQSEELFSTIFQHSPVGCAILTLECVFLNVNENLLKLIGQTAEQVIGRNALEFGLFGAEDDQARFFQQLRAEGSIKEKELEFFDTGGQKHFARCFANLVRIGDRECIFGMILDRTEERELEAKFLQAQKMESLGRLAGGVAHDFNNLLGVIGGYAELLEARLNDDGKNLRYCRKIMEATQRAGGLTAQLLTFSRKEISQPSPLQPSRVIQELAGILSRLIGEDVHTGFDLRSSGTTIIDKAHFEQIIFNIAVNARDAMPRGGDLRITTEDIDSPVLLASGNIGTRPYISIKILNTGAGMDEKTRLRAFEPFFTTKSMGRGTGLGLSTVYGIVQQCGGEINIESELGKGTCVNILIPAIGDSEPGAPSESSEELLRGAGQILLVEDEPELLSTNAEFLISLGYSVSCAGDGHEGLELARRMPQIDLAISDVVMPRMNGREFMDKLLLIHPGTKILFVSGYADDVVLRAGISRLGTPFLHKPFSLKELGRIVRNLITSEVSEKNRT